MADKQVKPQQEEAVEIVEKAKGFWVKHSKKIIIIGSAVIVLLASYIGYDRFVKAPNEKTADDLIFPAENLFAIISNSSSFNKDTMSIILNGDKNTNVTGLLNVANKYSGTESGNRAKYIIGACYLHLQQYDKAIEYLKDFDAGDALQVQSKAYIVLAYAYSEKKKTEEALDYFKKAGNISGLDNAMASEALFLAGIYANELGKTKDATEIFQKIKDNYPASQRVGAGDVDKYLASLGVTK